MPNGKERKLSDVEQDLLGLRLGLHDSDEAERLASSADDEALQQIDKILAPLSSYDCPVPHDLSARIESALVKERVLQFAEANATEDVGGGGHWLTSRDLLALAAAIILFVGVFFPSYQSARDRAERIACAGNLRLIGAGMNQYAEENDGVYPYAGPTPPGAAWAPNASARQFAPGSRHAWQLVGLNFVSPNVFDDPGDPFASHQRAIDLNGEALAPRSSYVAFDSPTAWRRYDRSPLMPITAGMTPLVDENRNLRRDGLIPQNSPNHGANNGQNVLRLDNSVQWHDSSRVGYSQTDDIFRIEDLRDDQYTGTERPRGHTDTFLTP